jgi:Protein of unknown function (DUF742)
MAGERDDNPGMVRPFLQRGPVSSDADVGDGEDLGVRPYYVTGGRTRSSNAEISFETMVSIVPNAQTSRLDFERLRIVELCRNPLSMAELSAKLKLPIGAVCVLAGDLATLGVLQSHAAPDAINDDIELIDTLIDALRRL